jgi:hypothetical protein
MPLSPLDFEAGGFERRVQASNANEAWVKHYRVKDSPYLHAHVEEGDDILGTMLAETVIAATHDGWVIQVAIEAANYQEEAIALDSEEGEALFSDAVQAHAAPSPSAASPPEEPQAGRRPRRRLS